MTHPTIFHLMAAKARLVLPASAVQFIRGVTSAIVTPLLWSRDRGHWKSCLAQASINAKGEPQAWYTYPAVLFLQRIDFSTKRVLELGAGNSTLWWAKRAAQVISLEGDRDWYSLLAQRVTANTSLHLVSDTEPADSAAVNLCRENAPFDVIVIDGLYRLGFALLSQEWLEPDGVVIFDNSNGYWGGDEDGTQPIIEHFRAMGFQRADFYGYYANGSIPGCTSIFFKQSFLFAGTQATL